MGEFTKKTCTVPKLLLVLCQLMITLVLAHQLLQQLNLFSFYGLSSFTRSVDQLFVTSTLDNVETIGVSITVTKCNKDSTMDGAIGTMDGAIVLQYSILQQPSKYRFKFYILHHPDALTCVQPLAYLGFTLLERDVPVNISLIEGDVLRECIARSGCCGDRELIKFEAFQLTEHPVIILFDMDMLVLKPLDELIDMILYNNNLNSSSSSSSSRIMDHLQWPENYSVVDDVWLLHVNDYWMSSPSSEIHPMQGGFAVIKPNRSIYQEIREIVLSGDFDDTDGGWGGKTGYFWGAETFQGLMPYYFKVLYPGHSLELKWCIHDAMNTRSRDATETDCAVPTCEDCSKVHPSEIYSFHYTLCYKPWLCVPYREQIPSLENCRHMHQAWFDTRSVMEASWGRTGRGNGSNDKEMLKNFQGYCTEYESEGYESIQPPYGAAA